MNAARKIDCIDVRALSPLVQHIERFLLASGMDVKDFGRRVGADYRLVPDMRCGRKVGPKLEAQIKLFISAHSAKIPKTDGMIAPSPKSVEERDEALSGFLRAESSRLNVPLIDLIVLMTRKGAQMHVEERGIEI